jgi:hypothetical protein
VQETKNWQGVYICWIGNGALHLVLAGTGIQYSNWWNHTKGKSEHIAAKLNIDCFSASSGWLSWFKDQHGLVFKKLAGESAEISVKSTDHGWKVCHLYWKVMNHAMYTTQTRRGYSLTCFLIEPWHIKEKLAMEENIPKTDSLCYCVLIVIEVTSKCQLWSGNPRNQGASGTLKNCQLNTTRIVKHGWRQRFFVRSSIL